MSMEEKVDREIQWDLIHNHGRVMEKMISICLRHANDQHEGSVVSDSEVFEAEKVLEEYGINPALTRIVEWLSRAADNLITIPLHERRAIQWPGSDKVTDINAYRRKDET